MVFADSRMDVFGACIPHGKSTDRVCSVTKPHPSSLYGVIAAIGSGCWKLHDGFTRVF